MVWSLLQKEGVVGAWLEKVLVQVVDQRQERESVVDGRETRGSVV